MEPTGPVSYRAALDGLRAVSVTAVVAWHLGGTPFIAGRLGVDTFFVLSGFLITTLLLAEHRAAGRVAIGGFYARRALRLVPALLLVCALVATTWSLTPSAWERTATLTTGLLGALLYVSAWYAAADAPLGALAHAWTLSVEEHFYLVWPFVVLWRVRRPRPVGAVTLLFVAAAAWRVGAWTLGASETVLHYRPDMRAHQLLAGAVAAVLLDHGIRVDKLAAPALALAATIVLAYPFVVDWWPDAGPVPVLFGAALAVLIAHLWGSDGAAASWLARAPLRWLGQRAYGIYLFHAPLVFLLIDFDEGALHRAPRALAVVVSTTALAAASYRFVERPALRLRHRFARSSADSAGRQA